MIFLVSGVAGDIGFGVGRILRDWRSDAVLHGIDIQRHHAGLAVYDYCAVAPKASSDSYISWLTEYLTKNRVDVFIPTSEAEIKIISEQRIDTLGGAKVLISNNLTVSRSLDKNICLTYLADNGISVPKHGLVGGIAPDNFPVVVKPRAGQGSKGVQRVDSETQYRNLHADGAVWQDYLSSEEDEYTCPVYRSSGAGTRILVLKRKLVGGLTGSGEVVELEEVTAYVKSIAEAMDLNGVMNVQLRMTPMGPLLFEINPRLSSTLVFRDKMGFSDLRWWLADICNTGMTQYIPPLPGTRFYRGAQEYIFTSETSK